MNHSEYINTIKTIATTLLEENRCDEAGVEPLAMYESADALASLLEWSHEAFALFEEFNKEFPSNYYRVGKRSREIIKKASSLKPPLEK